MVSRGGRTLSTFHLPEQVCVRADFWDFQHTLLYTASPAGDILPPERGASSTGAISSRSLLSGYRELYICTYQPSETVAFSCMAWRELTYCLSVQTSLVIFSGFLYTSRSIWLSMFELFVSRYLRRNIPSSSCTAGDAGRVLKATCWSR